MSNTFFGLPFRRPLLKRDVRVLKGVALCHFFQITEKMMLLATPLATLTHREIMKETQLLRYFSSVFVRVFCASFVSTMKLGLFLSAALSAHVPSMIAKISEPMRKTTTEKKYRAHTPLVTAWRIASIFSGCCIAGPKKGLTMADWCASTCEAVMKDMMTADAKNRIPTASPIFSLCLQANLRIRFGG